MTDFKKNIPRYLSTIKPDKCPLCGSEQWESSVRVYEISEFKNYKSVMPVIDLMCSGCGNTYFINAIKAGVVVK